MPTQDDAAAETWARLLAERAEVLEELEGLRARLETRGNYSLGDGDPMIYQWELNLALFKRGRGAPWGYRRGVAPARQGGLWSLRGMWDHD